jgi:hypothetical protein
MGFFTSLSSASLRSSTSANSLSSAGTTLSARGSGRGNAPETEEELVRLMNEMRAAFRDADTVARQLISGGEEGLTPAQLKR